MKPALRTVPVPAAVILLVVDAADLAALLASRGFLGTDPSYVQATEASGSEDDAGDVPRAPSGHHDKASPQGAHRRCRINLCLVESALTSRTWRRMCLQHWAQLHNAPQHSA